jgi:hypothetical protein
VLQLAHDKGPTRPVDSMEAQRIPEYQQARRSTCFQIGRPQYGEVVEPLTKESAVGRNSRTQATGIDREYISARLRGGPTLLGTWALHCDLQTRGTQIATGELLLHILLHHQVSMGVERIGDSQLA